MGGPLSVATPRPPAAEEADPPGLGFFDSIGPGFRRARAGPDWGLNQMNYEGRVVAELEAEARRRGWQPPTTPPPPGYGAYGGPSIEETEARRRDQLIAWYQAERVRDDKLLPQYAGITNRDGLREYALQRRRDDVAKADEELSGGSTAGQLVGAFGAGLADPTSYIPVGGAAAKGVGFFRQVLTVAGREAAANMAFTAVTEPLVRQDAAALGFDRTIADTATDLAVSGAVGGFIGGAAGTVSAAARSRRRAAGTEVDRDLVETFRRTVPEENWTPEEREAVAGLERASDIAEASPFEPSPAGDKAHVVSMDEAVRLALGTPAPPAPVARGTSSAPAAPRAAGGGLRSPEEVIRFVINDLEGGAQVVNFSAADGGTTKWGVAAAHNPGVDVANLTEAQAIEIARRKYWFKELDGANPAVAAIAFDAGYISGPKTGKKILRESGGDPARALALYRAHLNRIADTVPGKAKFKRGWNNRVDKLARKLGAAESAGNVRLDPDEPLPELPEIDRSAIEIDMPDLARGVPEPPDMPLLRAELFDSPEAHARAQEAFDREWGDGHAMQRTADNDAAPAATGRSAAPGTREKPTEEMVSNREFPPPATFEEAETRLAARVRRILESGEDYDKLDYNERVLLNAARMAEIPLTTPKGAARTPLAIARDFKESSGLTTVLAEEMGRVSGRHDWIDAAALRRPEIFTEDYRAELARVREEQGAGAFASEEELRDRILSRRAANDAAGPAVGAPDTVAAARFEDPRGDGVTMEIESLEHDLRMAAEADTAKYRLSEDGPEQTLAEIFADLDAEDRAVAALRACLAPARAA